MGLFDKPFGVQVGPFGASGTASELGSVLQSEQQKYQLQKMMELYKLNDWVGQGIEGIKQIPGQAFQAMPSFKVETPIGSFEKPSGSSLFGPPQEKPDQGFQPRGSSAVPLGGQRGAIGKIPLQGKPERPPQALGADPNYARLLDKFASQGRVSSAGPGMFKIMGPNGTPHYVTENQLYENLQALDKGWDEKLAGEKDQAMQTLPVNNRPGLSELLMPMGEGAGKVPYPDQKYDIGTQTGTPSGEKKPGVDWRGIAGVAGQLLGKELEASQAPGNERPFAQMGYYGKKDTQREIAVKQEEQQKNLQSQWERSQAEIQAELERTRMNNEEAAARQQAEQEAAWRRTQAEIASREKIYADRENDITITPEMAAKLGGPWAAMVGQKIPASVLGQSIGYQATQSGYMDRLERQQMLTDYENVQKALLDPKISIMLSPEELNQLRAKKDYMEKQLFPDMVRPEAPQGAMQPPPAAQQPQQPEGPGFLSNLWQAGKNAWNYMTSGGETDPNAQAPPQAPAPPSPVQPQAGAPPAPVNNPFQSLPVSQPTKQALLGIQMKHGNDPIALQQALAQLAQSVSPQERAEILKLQAQVKR